MRIENKFRHLELNGCVKRNSGAQRRWRAGYCFRCDFRTKTGAKEMLSIKRDNIRFYPNLRFELRESLKRKRRGGLPPVMWKNHRAQLGYKIAGPARSEYDKQGVRHER